MKLLRELNYLETTKQLSNGTDSRWQFRQCRLKEFILEGAISKYIFTKSFSQFFTREKTYI